jgi:hypothetical protein
MNEVAKAARLPEAIAILPESATPEAAGDMLDWQMLAPGSKAPLAKPAGGTSKARPAGPAYGIKPDIIATLCKVDVATARRWKSGTSRIPHAAAALLAGDLGAFSEHWQGWRIQGDAIVSPDGWQIRRDDALSVPLMHGQIQALRAELDQHKSFENTEEQPAPPEELPQIRA